MAEIEAAVEKLCIEANIYLNNDIKDALVAVLKKNDRIPDVRYWKVKNAENMAQEGLAICQDTGMTVVFIELGNQSGSLEAVWRNRKQRCQEGYKRAI